jgi:hypothetical protein
VLECAPICMRTVNFWLNTCLEYNLQTRAIVYIKNKNKIKSTSSKQQVVNNRKNSKKLSRYRGRFRRTIHNTNWYRSQAVTSSGGRDSRSHDSSIPIWITYLYSSTAASLGFIPIIRIVPLEVIAAFRKLAAKTGRLGERSVRRPTVQYSMNRL